MSASGIRITLRPTALLVLGVLLGAMLVGPAVARVAGPGQSDSAVSAAGTQTRAVSCASTDFFPVDSDTPYQNAGTMREAAGVDSLRCNPGLPHRAVVTRVRFSIHDGSISGVVGPCALKRMGLAIATVNTVQTMASVPATDLYAYSETPKRLTDTSISFATVDPTNYAYWLECQVNGSPLIGVYGADVTFTITGANG